MNLIEPKIINGNIFLDDRGELTFNNSFKFRSIKRFYTVTNHSNNFVRAWHGHQKEEKYFLCTEGSFMVGVVKIDNFQKPSKKLEVKKFFLTNNGCILYVPSGYANGFINFTLENKLIIFSNMDLEASMNDDYRYDYDYWNIWNKNFR